MAKAVTIGALRYDVVASTDSAERQLKEFNRALREQAKDSRAAAQAQKKFQEDARLNRKELRLQQKVIRETLTPIERYKQKVGELSNLRRKGAITTQQFTRAVQKEKQTLGAATGEAIRNAKALDQKRLAQQRLNKEIADYARKENAAANAARKRMAARAGGSGQGGIPGLGRVGTLALKFNMVTAAIGTARDAFNSLTAPMSRAIDDFAKLERQLADFEVLTGDAAIGQELTGNLRELARQTPLSTSQAAKAAQTMLSFGVATEEVVPSLEQLAEISGGSAERFQRLALAYSQAAAAGRLMGQDTLQFINAGFNPLQIISERTGRSMLDLKKAMEEGQISFKMVQQAMADATGEGGRFEGRIARAMETISGRTSRLQGQMEELSADAGRVFAPLRSGWLSIKEAVVTYTHAGLRAMEPVLLGANAQLEQQKTVVNETADSYDRMSRMVEAAKAAMAPKEISDADESLASQIDAARMRNLELRKGVEYARQWQIFQSDGNQELKEELALMERRNIKLEERNREEARAREERKQGLIEQQQAQIDAAKKREQGFEKFFQERLAMARTPNIPSLGKRGSREEYKALRRMRIERKDRAEQKQLMMRAEQVRQRLADETERQTAILEQLKDKLERMEGV